MQCTIDVSQNILQQFAHQLQLPVLNHQAQMDAPLGTGLIKAIELPGALELYHFTCTLRQPFSMHSFNPEGSPWLLININLSQVAVQKTVNNQQVNIQKYLPTGMLLYTPQTEVFSSSPVGVPLQIALVRFQRSLLHTYHNQQLQALNQASHALIYEDLDYASETALSKALDSFDHKMAAHAHLLAFLALFVDKLKLRETEAEYEKLHPDDLKGLFVSAAALRNPFAEALPTVKQLATMAGMGSTKYKSCFKQVFGVPPMQYHQKIKMEYARNQLAAKKQTPSELSYALGYSHPSKFTLAYKKQFGQLPSQV